MAIKKKLIHFKNYSDFNSKKLSANEANTQYTVGVGGAIQNGSPDILYQSICWIKDTKQQWTHGQLYDLSGGGEMPDLADVALSGDYNDLINKPTIPNGTITGVSANGTSVATSGVANIPAATTGKYGVTKLSSATNSTSTTLAATPSAVKSAYDLANGKYTKPSTGIPFSDFEEQVQGSIIKAEESVQGVSMGVATGNATAGNFFKVTKDPSTGNVSIQMIQNSLASGKIAIPYTTDVKQYVDNAVANAGGGGKEVVLVTSDIDLLEPNKVYIRPNEMYALQITQIAPPSERYGEYYIMGVPADTGSGTYDVSIIFPANIQIVWANGQIPSINSADYWELSIVYTRGVVPIYKCVLTKFASA